MYKFFPPLTVLGEALIRQLSGDYDWLISLASFSQACCRQSAAVARLVGSNANMGIKKSVKLRASSSSHSYFSTSTSNSPHGFNFGMLWSSPVQKKSIYFLALFSLIFVGIKVWRFTGNQSFKGNINVSSCLMILYIIKYFNLMDQLINEKSSKIGFLTNIDEMIRTALWTWRSLNRNFRTWKDWRENRTHLFGWNISWISLRLGRSHEESDPTAQLYVPSGHHCD